MLIALLAVLGVDLVVLVAVAAVLIGRKRWVRRRPGAFPGAIRAADGEIEGLRPKWHRGYGRWVGDVLVWTKAPLLFRNQLLPVDRQHGHRPARPDEVKRLGDHPVVLRLETCGATAEVAARDNDLGRLLGPYRDPRDGPADGASSTATARAAAGSGQAAGQGLDGPPAAAAR